MATMVSVMAFVATAVWVFTWKYQEEYGTKVAILTSVLLTGVGLYLFGFVLSAVPILVTNTRLFFQGETTLAYLFLDIPLAAIASGVAVGVTGLLFRSRSRSAGTEE